MKVLLFTCVLFHVLNVCSGGVQSKAKAQLQEDEESITILFAGEQCGCKNSGKCHVSGDNQTSCECPAGLNGLFCEHEIDECRSNPCQNNAHCLDGRNEFTCLCGTGFRGVLCELTGNDDQQEFWRELWEKIEEHLRNQTEIIKNDVRHEFETQAVKIMLDRANKPAKGNESMKILVSLHRTVNSQNDVLLALLVFLIIVCVLMAVGMAAICWYIYDIRQNLPQQVNASGEQSVLFLNSDDNGNEETL